LFTKIENAGAETVYFQAVRGIAPEFVFDAAGVRSVRASSGTTTNDSRVISVSHIQPGTGSIVDLVSVEGRKIRIVVLSPEQAENAWKVNFCVFRSMWAGDSIRCGPLIPV